MKKKRVQSYCTNYDKYSSFKKDLERLLETPQIKLSPLNPAQGKDFVLVLSQEVLRSSLIRVLEETDEELIKFEANFEKWDNDILTEPVEEPKIPE